MRRSWSESGIALLGMEQWLAPRRQQAGRLYFSDRDCDHMNDEYASRYLHFDNIDVEQPDISSRCSRCGQQFSAEPKPNERMDDVLLRIRAKFDAHNCGQ